MRRTNLVRSKSEIDISALRDGEKRMKAKVKLSKSCTVRNVSKVRRPSLPSTQSTAHSPERRRRKNLVESLECTLSPQYIGVVDLGGKKSRYGRAQKHKEDDDFLPTQIACYVRRTPPKVKNSTQANGIVQKISPYKSPIEKLIEKNKMLAVENTGSGKSETLRTSKNREDALFSELGISTVDKSSETPSEKSLSNYSEDRVYNEASNGSLISCLKSPSSLSTDSAKGSSIDLEIDFPVKPGDILWARISPFPFWPSMVWPDPSGRTIVLNNNKVQRQNVKIHVRFFGDNGRRGWVNKANIFPYENRSDFEKRGEECMKKFGKKHSMYRAFEVSAKRKNVWETAIDEADEVNACPHDERLAVFEKVLDRSREEMASDRMRRRQSMSESVVGKTISPTAETNSKRDRSPDIEKEVDNDISEDIEPKRMKFDMQSSFTLDEMLFDDVEYSTDDNELFNSEDFGHFYELIKKYIFKKENPILERHLLQNVRRIWYLRHLAGGGDNTRRSSMNIRKFSINFRELIDVSTSLKRSVSTPDLSDLSERTKNDKKVSKPIEEVVDDIIDLGRNYLFKGLNKEFVCKDCRRPTNLSKCTKCQSLVHKDCEDLSVGLHITGDFDDYKQNLNSSITQLEALCIECASGDSPKCFVCKKNNEELGELVKCHISWCPYHYHLKCLKYWPQSKITKSSAKVESLLCSAHVCHTCVSDDPRGKFFQIDKSKLVRCVECPATYHSDSFCIPAGTKFLTATQIVCPRHGKHEKLNINANWCFICATGGSLICCDTCPTAFHLDCLKIPQPDGNYICEECETGRLPLYGELVWAKLGNYRWWPAIIIPPPEVPKNLQLKKHDWSEFCIRFFGSNDHAWINRNRVFLYQEGDWGKVTNTKGINNSYKQGLEEAKRISELLKKKKQMKNMPRKDKGLAPLPYIKIKFNKAVAPVKLQELDVGDITPCECSPNDEEPCGPYSGCLNRLLVTECNPKVCPAGSKCQNQLFEKRLYPPLKVYWTSGKGWGLFGEKEIKTGTFVIEYVGEVIDDREFQRRIVQKQEEKDENYYFLTLEKEYIIDAGPKGNLARFMNHSCEPNCETQKWTVNGITRIGLFAIKDIPAKTELTFNYNLECLGDNKKICHCGSEKCSGFIGSKYKEIEKVPQKPTNDTKSKSKVKSGKRASIHANK